MWLQCPSSSSPSSVTSPPSVGCLAGTTFRSLLGPDSCWSPDLPASCRRQPLSFYLFMFVCVCVLCVCRSDSVFLCVYICCHDNLLSRYEFLHLENREVVGWAALQPISSSTCCGMQIVMLFILHLYCFRTGN